MLRKMARGDWIVFYPPKTAYPDGEPLQALTAIGEVADDAPFVDIVSQPLDAEDRATAGERRKFLRGTVLPIFLASGTRAD